MDKSLPTRVGTGLGSLWLAAMITSPVAAGPTWDVDYTEDAGQTALGSQVITHALSPYINIYGKLSGYGFIGSDFVDMYQIQITSQTLVSISTAGGELGGEATFDTQLFIFKRKGGNGNNPRAVALRANNDAAANNFGSRIGDEANASSNYTLLSPGFYYLAVTGVGMQAIDEAGGSIWPNLSSPGLTVSGNERFLGDWSGEGAIGDYHIRLHAIGNGGTVPAPGAFALLGLAGLSRRRRR